MKLLPLIFSFLLLSSVWIPVEKDEIFRPIYIGKCGENFLVGLDTNKNRIIDTCYELKRVDEKLYKKHVPMWFDVYDETVLKDQGCVCN